MGGLGPGIGGAEWLVIGLVALLVVGPERLPGLLRQLGKWVAKARGMANEFRSSFEDMARQSELDELRKEVEALRTGQPVRLGAEADAAFKDIKSEFDKPLFAEPVMTPAASEWPDGEPVMLPIADRPLIAAELIEAAPEPAPAPLPAPKKPRAAKASLAAVPKASPKAASKTVKTATPKPAARKAAPRNSKIDL
ncbi:MAG: twin-arginine translocation protein TatB subunit [Brevundimonas sp.]|nr:twin-arginine translocation protein TatB subunit [Brevundimonas sp.]